MVVVANLHDKAQTGEAMYEMVERFSSDIDAFGVGNTRLTELPLDKFFSLVSSLPYSEDPEETEVVTRPAHIFATPWQGWDCKKKAVAIAAWLKEHGIPYRFVAVSRRPDGEIHHVIVQACIGGSLRDIDATYPNYRLFQDHRWTYAEPLPSSGPGRLSGAPRLLKMYGDGPVCPEMMGEFNAQVPAYGVRMGEPATIIAAIIVALASITTAIVGAVANKKQQEREIKARAEAERIQSEIYAAARERIAEQAAPTEATPAAPKDLVGTIKENLLPIAAGVAGYFALEGGQ